MFKFVFTFHIFVLEGSMVNRVDSQFVFDSVSECRIAELLIQKVEDPLNCTEKFRVVLNRAENNLIKELGEYVRS